MKDYKEKLSRAYQAFEANYPAQAKLNRRVKNSIKNAPSSKEAYSKVSKKVDGVFKSLESAYNNKSENWDTTRSEYVKKAKEKVSKAGQQTYENVRHGSKTMYDTTTSKAKESAKDIKSKMNYNYFKTFGSVRYQHFKDYTMPEIKSRVGNVVQKEKYVMRDFMDRRSSTLRYSFEPSLSIEKLVPKDQKIPHRFNLRVRVPFAAGRTLPEAYFSHRTEMKKLEVEKERLELEKAKLNQL
eukprot:CAMPEP_0114999046 /NCGR_PEP_ID=MMETSP0216-20121206/15902_1 /TAXON_ID=223996 /ORGANISM="Protocruzia adherens, Strain Boccale" /LENGTH=239 /DNA_ID=CAMNT_0002363825 /DNA_START=30 /DNA_END=750 /DNA_ORIENTATION=+